MAVVLKAAGALAPGAATIIIAVLLLGGIQVMALGLIGEYVGRIYDEVKGRPLCVVRSRVNFVAPSADELDRVTLA